MGTRLQVIVVVEPAAPVLSRAVFGPVLWEGGLER